MSRTSIAAACLAVAAAAFNAKAGPREVLLSDCTQDGWTAQIRLDIYPDAYDGIEGALSSQWADTTKQMAASDLIQNKGAEAFRAQTVDEWDHGLIRLAPVEGKPVKITGRCEPG